MPCASRATCIVILLFFEALNQAESSKPLPPHDFQRHRIFYHNKVSELSGMARGVDCLLCLNTESTGEEQEIPLLSLLPFPKNHNY